MNIYTPTPARPRAMLRHIPPFCTVPIRARHDGWSPHQQATFIGHLAETRSVSAAAERVAMSREGAYRLRERPGADSFCAAWDAALGQLVPAADPSFFKKVTALDLYQRAVTVWWQVHLKGGKFVGLSQKHDNTALLRLLAQQQRARRLPPVKALAAERTGKIT